MQRGDDAYQSARSRVSTCLEQHGDRLLVIPVRCHHQRRDAPLTRSANERGYNSGPPRWCGSYGRQHSDSPGWHSPASHALEAAAKRWRRVRVWRRSGGRCCHPTRADGPPRHAVVTDRHAPPRCTHPVLDVHFRITILQQHRDALRVTHDNRPVQWLQLALRTHTIAPTTNAHAFQREVKRRSTRQHASPL